MNKYYESTKKYLKTPKGVLNIIYRNQLLKQKRRGIKVNYTYKEFKDKYLNDEKYLELYNQWLKNNCLSDYKPSFDRIDNTKDYSFDNLQIMTWRENNAKGRRECMKAVRQYDLSGKFVKTWESIATACRSLNMARTSITECLSGKRKTAYKSIWKYADEDTE